MSRGLVRPGRGVVLTLALGALLGRGGIAATGPFESLQTLVASDAGDFDRFGVSVALSGDRAVIGAFTAQGAAGQVGAAYVFRLVNGSWAQEEKIVPFDAEDGQHFGVSVAIEGDLIAVGSPSDNNAGGNVAGAVYLYRRAGGSWLLEEKLLASDGSTLAHFGTAVALSGGLLVAGARSADGGGVPNTGAVYIYSFDGASWMEDQILHPGDPTPGQEMGISVALSGTLLVAGAHDDELGNGAGAAYVFESDGVSFTQIQKLLGSDTGPGDRLGSSVDIQPPVVVVGSLNGGGAYVFRNVGGAWNFETKLVAPDLRAHYGGFCSLDGNRIALGEPEFDGGRGGVHLWKRSGGVWGDFETVTGDVSDPNAMTGSSLDSEAGMLLAGSYTDSPGGVREAGSVSFFRSRCDTVHVQSLSILLTGTAPVLQRTCRVVLIGGRPRLFCTSMRVGTNYTLAGEALLLDQDGAPLPGAEVDLTVSISGSFRRRTVVSDPIGGVRLSLGTFYVPKNRSRRVTLSVRDVRKPGFTFDRKGSILRTSRDL